MKIEIKSRWNDSSVLFAQDCENNSLAVTLGMALRADANLRDANLTPIRDDVWAVLSSAPEEVPALIDAIKNGKVDGSTYQGECACLVGTIANVRGVYYERLGSLKPNSLRPAERFFMGISEGDTPETNQFSKIAYDWGKEWLDNMQAAFCGKDRVSGDDL